MNTTAVNPLSDYKIEDYYLVCSLAASFCLIAVIICIIILILVWRTKPRLHTVNHLLMCNTCCATIFYCVIINNNYGFLIFAEWQTSDMSCRWRAYFAYTGVAGVIYSYLIQAISRFFFSILSTKYRWLTTFKTHYILISIQWLVVFLITLPAVITKDIYFTPNNLCWVPFEHMLHVAYTAVVYYIIPVIAIIIIYLYIYCSIRRTRRNATATINSTIGQKRDLELLRNILVLLSIYLCSGFITLLFFMTLIKLIYLINFVYMAVSLIIEKVCVIVLDREFRQVIKGIIYRRTTVKPSIVNVLNAPRMETIQERGKTTKAATVQHVEINVQPIN
jgi:hypothetical protein